MSYRARSVNVHAVTCAHSKNFCVGNRSLCLHKTGHRRTFTRVKSTTTGSVRRESIVSLG